MFSSESGNAQSSNLKQLSEAKILPKTRKPHPNSNTACYLLLTSPLIIFNHIGRGKSTIKTLIKGPEDKK